MQGTELDGLDLILTYVPTHRTILPSSPCSYGNSQKSRHHHIPIRDWANWSPPFPETLAEPPQTLHSDENKSR